jgi:hypothetical protein
MPPILPAHAQRRDDTNIGALHSFRSLAGIQEAGATGLEPDRLRAAALRVGIWQGDIIALALDAFLRRKASKAMSLQEQLSVTDFYTDSVLPARIVSGIAS